jgi:predicted nucleic acid-binding Zn ribbon protein
VNEQFNDHEGDPHSESITDEPNPHDTAVSHDEAMRVAARALGRARSSGTKNPIRSKRRARSSTSRDPQLVGEALEQLLAEQGWQGDAALARLSRTWAEVVGPEVAEHVQIESWSDGTLVLRADSTAWATQVRLLLGDLTRQVTDVVGPGTVREVTVKGPDAPSWRAGPRVVKGRGPRDTYG